MKASISTRPRFSRYVIVQDGPYQSLGVGEKLPVPKCMTPEQAADWAIAAQKCFKKPISGICTDCTPEYQRRMKREARCENPGVKFVKSRDDGDFVGLVLCGGGA